MLMLAYRTTPQESTKFTPCMLMLGRELELPLDLLFGPPPEHNVQNEHEYVQQLRSKFEIAHSLTQEHLQKSSEIQKRHYDQGVAGSTLHEGDLVWLLQPSPRKGLCVKLQLPWTGPWKIMTKLNDVTFRIRKTKHGEPKVVHYNRLKPYKGPVELDWGPPQAEQ